jgi:predicted ArsR family transcriptional regulator
MERESRGTELPGSGGLFQNGAKVMEPKDFANQVSALAALDEPVRRKLYLHVVGQDGHVSRDEAARGAGVSRALAAFHLDKLVEAGLLEASFRRLGARAGPGAGRPSKLYRRAPAAIEVSLPARRYELAAHVLAQALARVGAGDALAALRDAARERGRALAREASATGTRRGRPLHRALRALEGLGFEPRRAPGGELILRNCPFDALAAERRELVCGMNLALVEGLVQGLALEGVEARLAPRPGTCCVALRNAPPGGEPAPSLP